MSFLPIDPDIKFEHVLEPAIDALFEQGFAQVRLRYFEDEPKSITNSTKQSLANAANRWTFNRGLD